jgi:AraC family transcriptional regulator of adaptative response/methylated-DNA-[protein]-cysteine methyltransferase
MSTVSTSRELRSSVPDDPRWSVLLSRQATGDAFVYGVKTTGVFCRPDCASRIPKPANVIFFGSSTEALAAGFRPCKRCQPTGRDWRQELDAKIARACLELERSGPDFRLSSLAKSLGLSRFHFQRIFKKVVGLSPKQYQSEHRLKRFKRHLRQAKDVTTAIYSSGFGSAPRAYENVTQKLGMTPRQYRQGGEGEVISFTVQQTPIGQALIALSERGVCSIELGKTRAELITDLKASFWRAKLVENNKKLEGHVRQLLAHLEWPERALDFPLDIRGTAFQQQVWKALQQIKPGQTGTYLDLAQKVGKPKAVRAVASACAANMLALAVPCHRVVRSDGGLGGYRWGLSRKRLLLRNEKKG